MIYTTPQLLMKEAYLDYLPQPLAEKERISLKELAEADFVLAIWCCSRRAVLPEHGAVLNVVGQRMGEVCAGMVEEIARKPELKHGYMYAQFATDAIRMGDPFAAILDTFIAHGIAAREGLEQTEEYNKVFRKARSLSTGLEACAVLMEEKFDESGGYILLLPWWKRIFCWKYIVLRKALRALEKRIKGVYNFKRLVDKTLYHRLLEKASRVSDEARENAKAEIRQAFLDALKSPIPT